MEIPERWLMFIAVCFVALLCLVAYPVFAANHPEPSAEGATRRMNARTDNLG